MVLAGMMMLTVMLMLMSAVMLIAMVMLIVAVMLMDGVRRDDDVNCGVAGDGDDGDKGAEDEEGDFRGSISSSQLLVYCIQLRPLSCHNETM